MRQTKIHLTSFGPFMEVKENPSDLIAQEVKNMINATPDQGSQLSFTLVDHQRLDVTPQAVDAYFNQQNGQDDRQDVYIHIGVYRGLKDHIRLESVAWNEKSFPKGDADGKNICSNVKISECRDLTANYVSTLPLAEVLANASSPENENSSFAPAMASQFKITDDAGRYLCNYCFYRSCEFTGDCQGEEATAAKSHSPLSLFIHVADGDQEGFGIKEQATLVFGFLCALGAQMQARV